MNKRFTYTSTISPTLSQEPVANAEAASAIGNSLLGTFLFFFAHIPLAMLISKVPLVGFVHIIGLLTVGILLCLGDGVQRVPFVVAYIVGAEVFWRTTNSIVFYEQGKYLATLILMLAMWREGRGPLTSRLLFCYFLLLLPSTLLTLFESGLVFRKAVSFNMSGPFSLFVMGSYFYNKRMTINEFRSLLAWFIGPLVGLAFLCYAGLATTEALEFSFESSREASAGGGPNQVSTLLGCGVFFLFLLTTLCRKKVAFQAMNMVFMFWFLAQAILTFSRGGVLIGISAIGVALLFMMRIKAIRRYVILFCVFIVLITAYFMIPKLNEFTGDKLEVRYGEINTTGRLDLLKMDLDLFLSHPVLGVGVGVSKLYHQVDRGDRISFVAAHTEISRMIAEHGLLGLGALFSLMVFLFKNYAGREDIYSKAIVASLIFLGLGTMGHAAMRTALPAFVLGMTGISFSWSGEGKSP